MGASKIRPSNLVSILIGTVFTSMAQLFFFTLSEQFVSKLFTYWFAFDAIICDIFISEINFHK